MSSVSSTDGNSQYYQRKVAELENDYRKQKKELEEKTEANEARLEASYNSSIRKNEEASQKTADRMREHSEEQAARNLDYARAEIERVKNEHYDRFGRSHGMEADKLKEELTVTSRALEASNQANRERMAAADKDHERKQSETLENSERRANEATQGFRESVLARYEKSMADRKAEHEAAQADMRRTLDQLEAERVRDRDFNSGRVEEAVHQADLARDRGIRESDARADRHATETYRAADSRTASTIQSERDSHTKEVAALREKLNDASRAESHLASERAEGRSDAIREYENDWRARERGASASYEEQIAGLQHKAKESDDYNGQLFNRAMKDKDAYFAELIRKQGIENEQERRTLQGNYDRGLSQMKMTMEKDRELSRSAADHQLAASNAAATDALSKQAFVNQETLRSQKIQDADRIAGLERSLHEAKSSPDISVISPAAEENVRNYVAAGYDKKFTAERKRNEDNEKYLRETLTQRVLETSAQKDDFATKAMRDREALHQDEKNLMMDGMRDAQLNKEEALRMKDYESTRSSEMLLRNYSQNLEKQKREYENLIDTMKSDNASRSATLRQEQEFERKMAQRSFAAQQNELIRESEKKLSEQKVGYEAQLDQLKSQNQANAQEAERRLRTSLEEQGRNYEQRIAQLEASYKERERYTAQNYEDQLEKVKRSNALLIQKKS